MAGVNDMSGATRTRSQIRDAVEGDSAVAFRQATTISTSTGDLTLNPSGDTVVSGNLTVNGTQTVVNTVTMNAANAVVFEGATADAHETTLTIEDPTADRTVVIPNVSGTIPILAADSDTAITATPAEINLIDGGTARGTTAVASGDGILINDGGTMRMTNVDTVSTYFSSHSVGGSNIVTTGALNSGSITSGFGNIDTGSSTITTTGLITGGSLDVDDVVINGSNIGHTNDTDLITVADGVVTVAGELDATSLDVSGDVDIDGTCEADAYTVNGQTLSAYIAAVSVDAATLATTFTCTDNESANEDCPIVFVDGATGAQGAETDGDLHYNPSTGTVTATVFKGNIDAVDGDFDGTLETDALSIGGTTVSSTATELNFLDGSTAGTVVNGKALVYGNSGEVVATSLDVSGDADIDGTLEADAITVDGTALNEYIADTVGAMVGSNTESGITVAYQDGDNTLDFTVGTLNQDTTGTAAIATTVTVADESSDTSCNVLFATAATGNLAPKSGTNLTFNSSNGTLTATSLAGTLTTAAQTNVTSLGTLTALTVDDVAVDGKVITMTGSTNDTATITVGTDGTLAIATVDTDGNDADVSITADGKIMLDSVVAMEFDSALGIFKFIDGGTEFLRFTEGNSGDVTVKLITDGKDLIFTDNAAATNMKILDAAAGINVPGEVQTTKIAYTDGDDSMTIADGGKVTFSAGFAVGSDAAGDMLYHNGTSYVRLAKGSANQVLTMNDAANAPGWEAAAGGGGGAFGTTFTATKTSNYQVADGDGVVAVNTSGGAFTIELPSSGTLDLEGKQLTIKDVTGGCATNALTIATEGSETIDGAASITITQAYGSVTLACDGSQNFWIM